MNGTIPKLKVILKSTVFVLSEAVSIWLDDSSVEIPDVEHSTHEERWIKLGLSRKANLLVVVYCEKIEGHRIRIISARTATKNESKQYNSR